MTRAAVIKEFFRKIVIPVVIAGLLYCIFQFACMRRGELALLWLWILCGLPFSLHRMFVWIVPGGGSLGGSIALFAMNFIIGGIIGGFVLAWRLLVATWYIPLTVYRLVTVCSPFNSSLEKPTWEQTSVGFLLYALGELF